jgi:hypothetical protein
MVFGINTAALVEALFEEEINPDIVTTVVAGRYDELRTIVFGQLGQGFSVGGVSQALPKEIPALVQAYKLLAMNGNLCGNIEEENVSEAGYTLTATD